MGVRKVPKNLSRLFEAMVEGRIHRSQELIESCKQSVAHTRQLLRVLEESQERRVAAPSNHISKPSAQRRPKP